MEIDYERKVLEHHLLEPIQFFIDINRELLCQLCL